MLDELIEIEEILLYNHVLLNVLEKVQSIQRKYGTANKARILM